jgi:hypothetical protein
LIKIINEFHCVLAELLACVRISLLVFHLKIEVVVEDILKICYIEVSVNDNVLAMIYLLFTFLYIGRGLVKMYFSIINFDVPNNIVAAMIIKSIIILPFINSKIF